MTLTFTDEERKHLRVAKSGSYRLTYDEKTPERIKKSLDRKFAAHKAWINGSRENGGDRDGKH